MIRLMLLEDAPQFQQELDAFLGHYFSKGVPALFTSLRPFYARHTSTVEAVVSARVAALRTTVAGGSASLEDKTQLAWALHFMAQHQDAQRRGCEVRCFLASLSFSPPHSIQLLSRCVV